MNEPVPQRAARVAWSWGDGTGTHHRLLAATLADCRDPEGCDAARMAEYAAAGHNEAKLQQAVDGAWKIVGDKAAAKAEATMHDVDWSVDVINPIPVGSECQARVVVTGRRGSATRTTANDLDLRDPRSAKEIVDDAYDSFRTTPDDTGNWRTVDTRNRMNLHQLLQEKRIMLSQDAGVPQRLELAMSADEIQSDETWECCGIPAPIGGVTIVYGRGGSLKSRAVFESLLRIALYDDRKVLLLDTEPFHPDLKRRGMAEQISRHVQDAQAGRRFDMDLGEHPEVEPLDPGEAMRRVRENMDVRMMPAWTIDALRAVQPAIESAHVVCIDSVTACVSDDISNSGEAMRWFRMIQAAKAKTVVAVAHQIKGASKNRVQESSPLGTQTWESNARLTIAATPIDGESNARTAVVDFEAVKTNCSTPKGYTARAAAAWEPAGDVASVGFKKLGIFSIEQKARQKLEDCIAKLKRELEKVAHAGMLKTPLRKCLGSRSEEAGRVFDAVFNDEEFAVAREGSGVRWWLRRFSPVRAVSPPCNLPAPAYKQNTPAT